MTQSFGQHLQERFQRGSRLCVGIDPHPSILEAWEVDNTPQGAEYLGRSVIETVHRLPVACVKPQIALFERFGAAGFAALERILADAKQAGVLSIADVKRGDIGSTFAAYAETWLAPGSPLEADAMTAHAYHGPGSLSGAHPYIETHGKGLFVLAATSNPEASVLQRARIESGPSVAQYIVEEMSRLNESSPSPVGSFGVVLGATLDLDQYSVSATGTVSLPVLAPGFGHQGAQLSEVNSIFGNLTPGVIPSESRSVLSGGPHELAERVRARCRAVQEAFA